MNWTPNTSLQLTPLRGEAELLYSMNGVTI